MRSLALALCAVLLFGTATLVQAYYDDSVVIEIEGGLPPDPEPEDSPSGSAGGGGSSGGGSSSGGSTGGGSGGGGGSGTGDTGFGGVLFGFSEDNPWLGTSGGSGGTAEDELFDLLVAQGAIVGVGTSDPTTGADAAGGAGITINATKLRAALRGNDSFRQILEDFGARARSGGYQKGLSQRDFGLLAASAVLEDTNIDELTFGATKFEIVYRSRGYLIGFIPKTFSAHIMVNPQTTIVGERVTITLPWYRFFLRKLFSPTTIMREIEALIAADVRVEGDTSADVQARLFEEVSLLLKEKIGTVSVSR